MVKACVVGAGAIGGFIGARLSAAGECEVSALARGATLDALREHGWRLREGEHHFQSAVKASDRAEDLGIQDVVVVSVKAQAMRDVARQVATLCGPETTVISAMNGVPWWFGHGTPIGEAPLASVDPDGLIASAIPASRVLGCVVHASASSVEPGVVRHGMGRKLILGEAVTETTISERTKLFGALFSNAGFDVSLTADIRYEIWYKLWGNLTMNPISAMTGATIDLVLADPLVRAFCSRAMIEAAEVGRRFGCEITQSPEDRHEVTARLGAFKPSMLQDVEAGRAIELDGIVAAAREIGSRLGCVTPNIDAILGLGRLFGRVHGLYPAESR